MKTCQLYRSHLVQALRPSGHGSLGGRERINDRLIHHTPEWELVHSRVGWRLIDSRICGDRRRDQCSGHGFRLRIENSEEGMRVMREEGRAEVNRLKCRSNSGDLSEHK